MAFGQPWAGGRNAVGVTEHIQGVKEELTPFVTWGACFSLLGSAPSAAVSRAAGCSHPSGVLPESRFSLGLWENGTHVEEDALHGGSRVSPIQAYAST